MQAQVRCWFGMVTAAIVLAMASATAQTG